MESALQTRFIDRREFVRFAVLLGSSTASAYAMAGLAMPGTAYGQAKPRKGGKLRVALRLGDISDPHTYSWGQDMFVRV